jgi:sugar phosphate isomerase/epimerase
MDVSFSTLACPDWTLDRVARLAGELGWDGVELRTFGFGESELVCDPAMTDPVKVHRVLGEHGVSPACIATSLKFDRGIFPPVLGRAITDQEREMRQARRLIELAARMDCPFVRVFAFEPQRRETRRSAVRRIAWRLGMAVDAARNTGVRVVLENGGGFTRAADLIEIMDLVQGAALGACYSVATARHAGDDPLAGLDVLGERVSVVRLKGHRGGRPCLLGDGEDPNEDVVRALAARRFAGALVYEYDLLWQDADARAGLPTAEAALAHAIEMIYSWRDVRRVARGPGALPAMQPLHA